MIDRVRLMQEDGAGEGAAVQVRTSAGLRRLVGEFPQLHLTLGETPLAPAGILPSWGAQPSAEAEQVVRVSMDAWRSGDLEPLSLTEQLAPFAAKRPVTLELRGRGDLDALAQAALEISSACQSFMDRRNVASAGADFDEVLARRRRLETREDGRAQLEADRARCVWQWVLRLDPEAGLAVQVAALFSGRETSGVEPREHATSALRSLAGISLPPEVSWRIAHLMNDGDPAAEDPARQLLLDAEALTFFSFDVPRLLPRLGVTRTSARAAPLLEQMSLAAFEHLGDIRVPPVLVRRLQPLDREAHPLV